MAKAQGLYSHDKDGETGLTKNQKRVLTLLTGPTPKTQLEVADELGVSRQRIRQIVEDLLRKGYEIPNAKPAPNLS